MEEIFGMKSETTATRFGKELKKRIPLPGHPTTKEAFFSVLALIELAMEKEIATFELESKAEIDVLMSLMDMLVSQALLKQARPINLGTLETDNRTLYYLVCKLFIKLWIKKRPRSTRKKNASDKRETEAELQIYREGAWQEYREEYGLPDTDN